MRFLNYFKQDFSATFLATVTTKGWHSEKERDQETNKRKEKINNQSSLSSFFLGLLVLVFMKQKHEQQGHWNKNFISVCSLWISLFLWFYLCNMLHLFPFFLTHQFRFLLDFFKGMIPHSPSLEYGVEWLKSMYSFNSFSFVCVVGHLLSMQMLSRVANINILWKFDPPIDKASLLNNCEGFVALKTNWMRFVWAGLRQTDCSRNAWWFSCLSLHCIFIYIF